MHTETAAEFDSYAEGYDAGMKNPLKRMLGSDASVFLRVKIEWMLNDLRRRPVGVGQSHLLEYGCGHGLFLKVLAESGFAGKLTGCDVSREMLRQAAHTWENENRSAPDFFLIDADDPMPRQACCDIVVLCAVLHHIEPAERAAAYRQRVRGS